MVRLDAYIGLLTKSKERLEQKFTALESVLTTWRLQRTFAVDSSTPFVFCHVRTRRPRLTELDDIVDVFKDEGVELILFLCIADRYKRMFYLSKRVTMETTCTALLQRHGNVTTDLENLDNNVVVDWRGCMVVWPDKRTVTEVHEC